MAAENHIIDYDQAVKDLNATLKSHVTQMTKVVEKYKEWKMPDLPSEYINQLNQVNTANEKIAASNKKVVDSTKAVKEAEATVQQTLTTGASLYKQKQTAIEKTAKAEKKAAEDSVRNAQKEASAATEATRKKVQGILDFRAAMEKQKQTEIETAKQTEIAAQKAAQRVLEQSRSYIKLQNSWRQAQKALADSIVTDGAKAQSTKRLQREFDVLDKKIKQVDAATKNYSKNVGNYQSAFGGLGSLTSQLAGALGWMGAVTVAVGLLRNAFNTIKDFDSGLLNVAKTTGLAGKELKQLGVDIRGLAQELKVVPIKNLMEYATVAGQLGVKGSENILKFTKALAMLETASDITGQEGGAQIARLLTLVDGGVQNVEKFGDEIVKLGNNFAATESEILGNATAIAQNTGVYKLGRQSVLAYGTATKAVGIEAEITGSTIGRVLAELENSIRTGQNIETVMNVTKKSASELKQEFKTDASSVLYSFVKGLNDIDKSGGSVLGTLDSLGITAVRDKRVIASLATGGYDVLTRALNNVGSAAGSMQEEFDTASKKIENSINMVKVSWESLILSINGSENAIGSLASKWLIGLSLIIDKINEATTSWKDLIRISGAKIEQENFSNVRDFYKNYNTDAGTRQNASTYFKQLQKEEKEIIDKLTEQRAILNKWQDDKLLPDWTYLGLDKAGKAKENIAKLSDDLKAVQGTLKGINSLTEDYNSLASKKGNSGSITDVEGESEKERKKRLAAERKAAQALKKLTKEQIESQYDLKKATLEKEKAQAESLNNMDLLYTKEQELASADLEKKNKLADIEISDKKSRENKKLANYEEYIAKIIELNKKELKDLDDKSDKENKKNQERLKNQEDFWKKIKDLATQARTQQFDLSEIDIESRQLDTRAGSKAFNDLEREKLEKWISLQRDILKEGSKELDIAEKEYELGIKKLNKTIEDNLINGLKGILEDSFGNMGFGSLSALFDDNLKNMWENTESTTAKMAIAFQVFGQIANDVFAKLKASSDAYYDNQYNQLEKEKEIALKYAGENTAGKEAIEEQYKARKEQLEAQQAKKEKDMAIFQAFINMATGISSAIARVDLYPYNFVLAGIVGALGAAQIASIQSQPLPAFWKGTQNAPEGWAIVDELRPEVHTDKHGNPKSFGSTGGANIRYLEKGDKIYPSFADFHRDMEMSGSYIDRFGGIHIENTNNGISKEDMREVMRETIGGQSKQQTVIDENGFNTFVINGQSKTRVRNRRSKFGR